MTTYFYMIVDIHFVFLPLGILVCPIRQRFHGRFVDRCEELPSRYLDFLKRPVVHFFDLLPDNPVQLTDAEERVISECGDDPSLCDENRGFDFCLIPGLFHPGRDYRRCVVCCHVLIGRIEIGLIP